MFSTNWKSSKKPKKQRKYRNNAPLHIKGKFLSTHLSKELRNKHGKRAIRVRTGDKVKILRGSFKGQSGKVEKVDVKMGKVWISKMEVQKKDGTKALINFEPSNLMIIDLDTSDKKRIKNGTSKTNEHPKKLGTEKKD